jgi:hypothetical protein
VNTNSLTLQLKEHALSNKVIWRGKVIRRYPIRITGFRIKWLLPEQG